MEEDNKADKNSNTKLILSLVIVLVLALIIFAIYSHSKEEKRKDEYTQRVSNLFGTWQSENGFSLTIGKPSLKDAYYDQSLYYISETYVDIIQHDFKDVGETWIATSEMNNIVAYFNITLKETKYPYYSVPLNYQNDDPYSVELRFDHDTILYFTEISSTSFVLTNKKGKSIKFSV